METISALRQYLFRLLTNKDFVQYSDLQQTTISFVCLLKKSDFRELIELIFVGLQKNVVVVISEMQSMVMKPNYCRDNVIYGANK